MTGLVIENGVVATVDGDRTMHESGHVLVEDGRITAVGAGPAPEPAPPDARRVDAGGCLVTPGFVNTHQHLYQWATRGLAVDEPLFGWLTALYPVWAGLDAEITRAAATGALAWLARTGCTTASDHHYVFPRDGGDLLAAEVGAAADVGLRFHATRGSMDLGTSRGGLPPDEVVEDVDAILAATEAAIDRFHDPSRESMLRVAVAPCSPFTASGELLKRSAELARAKGVRMHTHLAETADEDDYCREHFGCTPTEYARDLGWLGPDVWLAHAVHLDDAAIGALAVTGTGVAHCPSSNGRLGSGICRVRELREAGVPVGLGVDGAASSELTSLAGEMLRALLFQRAVNGPTSLSARRALEMGTLGGAACLGRQDEIGTLEPGKLADIALWRVDGFRAALDDPVAALVFGPTPPLARLLVGGTTVVADGELRTVDHEAAGRAGTEARRRLIEAR
jgi:cytosine/adenosine deaminase-related metal-dependent hydrolase